MKRRLSREDAQRDPNLIWNEFIALLAASDPQQLDPNQRPAHLAFWYDAEVQNGGHLQFFLNRPSDLVPETVLALHALGAAEQAALLESAFGRWRDGDREAPETAREYVEAARQMEFDDLDSRYYRITPSVIELLEKHLEMNRTSFLEWEFR